MKKLFFVFALSIFSLVSYSQTTDTTHFEQYCEVVASGRFLSSKVTITVEFGEGGGMWTDKRIKDDQGEVQKFNSVVDALNYMGKNSWKVVNAFPVSSGNCNVYHFFFKKEFTK